MSETRDVQLPVANDPPAGPWMLPEHEPTTFIALVPGDAPEVTHITSALASVAPQPLRVLGEIEPQEQSVRWAVVVETETLPAPVLIWCEPAQPLQPGELDDPVAHACAWVVGAETLLGVEDSFAAHTNLLRLLAAGISGAPAILDVNTALWHARHELHQQYLDDAIDPPADGLWVIHSVRAGKEQSSPDDLVWLHTHGMWRCGRPELEMLEVPAADVSDAAALLNDIASLVLDSPPPAPGEPYEIGRSLNVTFQPWQTVMETLNPDAPGGPAHRENDHEEGHTGVRAVICDVQSRGTYKQVWTWPQRVLEQLRSGDAVLYMTERATQRQEAIAQKHWPRFVDSIKSEQPPQPDQRIMVKAGFARGGDAKMFGREHLWIEIDELTVGAPRGRLLHTPEEIPGLAAGDTVTIDPEMISDWQVIMPDGVFGPDDMKQIEQHLPRDEIFAQEP